MSPNPESPSPESPSPESPNARRRRRAGRRAQSGGASDLAANTPPLAHLSATGGWLKLLDDAALSSIHHAALTILAETGFSEAPDEVIDLVTASGGGLNAAGRLLFPNDLVTTALANLPRQLTLHARRDGADLYLGGDGVYVGTGGASPEILDLESRRYRPSVLGDIYAAARVVDQMPHIHFFCRPMVARDLDAPSAIELNTAWASLGGTTKHVVVSASSPSSVDEIARLVYMLAGSEAAFREAPFLSLNINHVVPPLRFDADSALVLIRAVECGIPVMANTFGQLGASSPVTIAGCVAQTTAETLAGVVLAYLANNRANKLTGNETKTKVVFGPRPMITDLRTGAMSGGGGEQAKLTAAAIQMARFYGLPSSTIAGATDSKSPDAQSGYEKCLAVTLAVQAGGHFITQASGAQASLMGTALESYVIDNDMLGSILSAHTEIEVSPETLDTDAIHAATTGAGHFLGEAETLARMNSDFLYPQIADRRSISEWHDAGTPSIWQRANERVRAILDAPSQPGIDAEMIERVEADFDLAMSLKPVA